MFFKNNQLCEGSRKYVVWISCPNPPLGPLKFQHLETKAKPAKMNHIQSEHAWDEGRLKPETPRKLCIPFKENKGSKGGETMIWILCTAKLHVSCIGFLKAYSQSVAWMNSFVFTCGFVCAVFVARIHINGDCPKGFCEHGQFGIYYTSIRHQVYQLPVTWTQKKS